MAAEVVGSAFVRIRALTTGLSKDIERGVKKGAAEADVEAPAASLGKRFADSAGKEIDSGLTKSTKTTVKKIGDDKTVDDSGANLGIRFARSFTSTLNTAFPKSPFTRNLRNRFAADGDKIGGRAGTRTAVSFGDRLVAGLKKMVARLIPVLTPSIASIVSFVTQYAVALVGQVGFLVDAVAGGGVAISAAFASVGTAVFPLFAAFKVETPRLKRFQAVAESVGKAWREFGVATQKTLLPALTRAIQNTRKLIPLTSKYGEEVGRITGIWAEYASIVLTSEESQRRLSAIFEGSKPILNNFFRILVSVGDILSSLWEAALPAAQAFSEDLVRIVERWADVVNLGRENGTLTATLDDWYFKTRLVFAALGDVLVGIRNIFAVGSEESVPFFVNFFVWAQEFRDWTSSEVGQNKLAQIFEDAREVAQAFNGLVGDVFDLLGTNIFKAGGNEGIIAFIEALRFQVLPFLESAIKPLVEELGPQLTEFFLAFVDLVEAIGDSGAIGVTVALLTALTEVLTALLNVPGMTTFLGFLLGFAGAVGALNLILPTFITNLAGLVGGALFSGFLSVIGVIGSAITSMALAVGAFLQGAEIIAGTGAAIAAGFAIVIGVIIAVIAAVVLLVIHWDKVKEAFNAVTRFIKDPMKRLTQLKENIEDLIGSLRDLGGKVLGIVGRALASFGGFLKEKLEDAIGEVIDFFIDLPGNIVDVLGDLGGTVANALSTFGGTVIDAILAGVTALPGLLRDALVGAMQFAITAFVLSFTGIPQLLFLAARQFGPTIGRFLVDAFTTAFDFLVNDLPNIVKGVGDFFFSIPERIIRALAPLGGRLLSFFGRAITSLANWLTGTAAPRVLKFFIELPGRVMDVVSSLPGRLLRFFQDAMDDVRDAVQNGADDIFEAFRALPGRILSLGAAIFLAAKDLGRQVLNGILDGINKASGVVGSILSGLKEGLEDLINDAIDIINDGIPDRLGFINIPDNPIPHINLAQGGIFDSATFAQIGEAGREVVIPLTKPRRALELVIQSGLGDILAKARGTDRSSTVTVSRTASSSGGMPLVQHIYTSDPVQAASEAARRHRALRVALTLR